MLGRKLRIVFMGTPDFAVESLKCIHKAGFEITGVITAPDKPAGRGKKVQSSAVKQYAEDNNLGPILQPVNLKDQAFQDELNALQANLFVVVAFRMLPETVWSMPELGTINLHASLLPQYRGAAPINWAIINGDKKTGVTTFFIEREIDTGKIIKQEQLEILPSDNAGTLHDKLMHLGAETLINTLQSISDEIYNAVPQKDFYTTQDLKPAPKIFKEDCRINWDSPVKKVNDFIRGLSPYPAAWTELQGNEKNLALKIYDAEMEKVEHTLAPGTIVFEGKSAFKVATMDGMIKISTLQQAGKKSMKTEEFLRGFNGYEEFLKAL